MQATDKPFHTLLLLGLVVFFTGNGGGAQEPFDDTDFGDLINDDGPTVAGVDQRRSTSKPAANVDDMQAGDGDYGDYTVDDDAVIANGSVDEAIQPNATISPVFVNAAVIGGFPLPAHKYPFVVSLQRMADNSHFCGGTLISSIHVVTAAHCFFNAEGQQDMTSSNFRVGVGMHNHRNNGEKHYFRVKRIQIHSQYIGKENMYLNDIALLTLDGSTAGRGLRSGIITLPTSSSDDAPPRSTVLAIGWGLTRNRVLGITDNTHLPSLLHGTHFTVISSGECSRRDKTPVTPSKMCIDSSRKAVCSGDSGGPLFRQLPSRNYQLIGVASYVIGDCMKEGSANFFTRVSHFVTWIKDALASNRGRDRQRPSQPPSSSSATGCRTTSENGMTCRVCNNGYRYSKECSGSYSSSWSSSSSGSRFSSTCVSRSCNPFARRFYGWLSQL